MGVLLSDSVTGGEPDRYFAHEAFQKITNSGCTEPMPSASSTEPMPSASSEPSRAAHSATVPSSLSSDSSEAPGRRRGPRQFHLLASPRPSAAPEPRNHNVWKKMTGMRRFRSCCLGRELCRWKRTRLRWCRPSWTVTNLLWMCQRWRARAKVSVVLGLLMDLMMSSGHGPSRILRGETVITHGKQAGLAEDGVDERVLWLGRPPSKSSDMKSIGIFADQLEERVTEKLEGLPMLRSIENLLRTCKVKIHEVAISAASASFCCVGLLDHSTLDFRVLLRVVQERETARVSGEVPHSAVRVVWDGICGPKVMFNAIGVINHPDIARFHRVSFRCAYCFIITGCSSGFVPRHQNTGLKSWQKLLKPSNALRTPLPRNVWKFRRAVRCTFFSVLLGTLWSWPWSPDVCDALAKGAWHAKVVLPSPSW